VIAAVWIEKGLAMVTTAFIPSPLGAVTDYVPTGPEIAIAVGVYAIGGLILTILYNIVRNIREPLEPLSARVYGSIGGDGDVVVEKSVCRSIPAPDAVDTLPARTG
jgi:hypothetical protein